MRKKISEPERLDTFIHSFRSYNPDSKAIVLRMVDQLGSVAQVASLTGLSERTIYDWIGDWNKKKSQDL